MNKMISRTIIYSIIGFTILGATERFKEELFNGMKDQNRSQ